MVVTGRSDDRPLLTQGSPTGWTQQALDVIAACCGHDVATIELLGERAALMGLARRSPLSAGGACRLLPTRDGWFAISLARPSDHELVPALVEDVDAAVAPWQHVEHWLRRTDAVDAEARTTLLGLAAASVPSAPPEPARGLVVPVLGAPRTRHGNAPLVVDLSSLWAGPLCAQLLHRAGARVITVESRSRPDGARRGSSQFYELLHHGHESVVLDFSSEFDVLEALLGTADVVIEASRPRALAQLGIDPLDYVAAGTIWVSVTAYGRDGDAGMRVGFGDDVAAGAGLVVFDEAQPCFAGDALADPLTGVSAAAAAMLALRGEHGCLLDVSMHDVAAAAAQAPANEEGEVMATRKGWIVACGNRNEPVAGGR